ncbi:MAG TPA: class I SAM-dependent methyltransferase [Gemmatimonadaceae bacterium]|nr:class I SAM-dependent methyltransferase [Gemmatimonadaceae bacterium]
MLDRDARTAARAAAQARMDAASDALARGAIPEPEWQRRVSDALAAAYLADDDPRWQSGFDGDAALWRQARELVLDAVPRSGSLLDVGCANGHLMECLAVWARERGLELTLYGLELSPALADAARRRLPAWADRIHTGNVAEWVPPARFTYVRTGLEYVAPRSRARLVARLLRDVVEPAGRLIVGPVYESDVADTVRSFVDAGVPEPAVVGTTDRNGKTRHVVWAGR